jgi:uncharacterized paraquat-inducible protein A
MKEKPLDNIFTMDCPHCGKKINAIKVNMGKKKECPKCKNSMDKQRDKWVCRFSLCGYQENIDDSTKLL